MNKQKISRLLALALTGAVLATTLVVAPAAAQTSTYRREDDVRAIKETGYRYKDLVNFLKASRNRVFSKPILAVGGTAAKVKTTTNTLFYSINGQYYSKAATDDFCTLTTGDLTSAQARYFRLEIDTDGNCGVVVGAAITIATGGGVPPIPARSKAKATMGIMLITGVSFTAGTTSLTTAAAAFTDGDPDLIDLLEQ